MTPLKPNYYGNSMYFQQTLFKVVPGVIGHPSVVSTPAILALKVG